MNELTIAGVGFAVLGSKDVLNKLLGPTAEYIDGETKGFVEKCNINLDNIFKKAIKKLGKKIDEHGMVSSRIFKHVLDEGRFCEDDLTAEYFGGILASSRSDIKRDDRGLSFLSVVKDLSVYQIRLHYVFYMLLKKLFNGQELNAGLHEDRMKMNIFIPMSTYTEFMEFSQNEEPKNILTHSLNGLHRNALIDIWQTGSKADLEKSYREIKSGGMVIHPSLFGIELFLWACGYPHINPAIFLTSDIKIEDFLNIDRLSNDISVVIDKNFFWSNR